MTHPIRNHAARWIGLITLAFALNAALLNTVTFAQQSAPHVTLVGRAILPALSYADGPPSGVALTVLKNVNGVRVPFSTQPFSGLSAITANAEYKGTWLLLTDHGFNKAINSGDYLLRTYTIEIDWHTAAGGSGVASLVTWATLADPNSRLKTPLLASTPQRPLTGSDFDPRAIGYAADKSLWIGEAQKPSLLNISTNISTTGTVLDQIVSLPAGVLEGMGIAPSGKLLEIAQHVGSSITISAFDTASHVLSSGLYTYTLDAASDVTSGWLMINDRDLLVIEQDGLANAAAKIKRIYLVTLPTAKGAATKTLLADLLAIDDPSAIATNAVFNPKPNEYGLSPFRFAFESVSSVYLSAADTLLVANNNHFPFGKGRDGVSAANTEFIQIKLAAPLSNVQLKLDNQ